MTSNVVESYPTTGQLPHPKLLQFWENRRPPYWGTWRKKSQSIGPRKPFSIDEVSDAYLSERVVEVFILNIESDT